MNIAVISFDQDFINQIKRELPDAKIRGYIDSLSMLKELSEFNPDIIIYDASSGDFAIDDLKFLLTREKVEKKKFRVLLSREQPVDIDTFPEVENIIYYTKETDIPKLITDITEEVGPAKKPSEATNIGSEIPSPENMESFLEHTSFGEEISSDIGHFGEFSISKEEEMEIKESLEFLEEHKPPKETTEEKVENVFSFEEEFKEEPSTKETFPEKEEIPAMESLLHEEKPKASSGLIKIEIDISVDDIKNTIAEKATEKLIQEVLQSPEMKEVIENIQRDFVERTEEELEKLKEQLKEQLKENVLSSIEAELKESLIETIKEDVAKLTAQIVKERLEQLFGGK